MRLKYPLMKMYVKSTGSDSNLGNFVNNAFATLDQCWNVITEQEVADGEYEIYISGTITGKQIIPKTTTGTNALNIKKDTTVKSILISGNSALSGGSPQDTINANVGDTAASGGSAITINTDVPVTFKKINITGGNTTGNGGGLNISSSSNVTVDANVCIYANYANKGAGVCNNGYLYIGYSSAKSDKTPDKTESGTPVIQYNSGLEGCGIYNKDNFFVYMRIGDISFNEGTGIGIGVYTSGTFTMSGGSITNNKNKSSNNNRGGGVYIY